jgi:hypothetical protein
MKKIYRTYISIILIFVIICCILILYNKYKELFTPESNLKNVIAVLTKGYDTVEKYDNLIKRNEAIFTKFYNKLKNIYFDIIIFHEGNINDEHQKYIQSKTPDLPLKFIAIKFYNNNTVNDICPPTELSKKFSNGYKNMCYFWSIDFLEYLKDYNYMIRIDEDCIIDTLDINIINKYTTDNIMFSSAKYELSDNPDVIVGMENLFNNFLSENNLLKKNELKMPYTNFMIVNIPFLNNNKVVQNILNKIKDTNCIFSNRWGDLPIWGYILSYLVDKKYFIEDSSIKYYHGSHDITIN